MNARLFKKNLLAQMLFSVLCVTHIQAETLEKAQATEQNNTSQQTKEVDAEMLKAGRHALQLGKEGTCSSLYKWQTLEYEPNGFLEGLSYQVHLAPENCYFNEYGMFLKEENNEQEEHNARVRVRGSLEKFPIKAIQLPAQETWNNSCCDIWCVDLHDANNELPVTFHDGSLTKCKVWQYRTSNRKAVECHFLTTHAALLASITRKNIETVKQDNSDKNQKE